MRAPDSSDNAPHWRADTDFAAGFPAGRAGRLLRVRTSMTGVLRELCAGDFRLRVVEESATHLDRHQHGTLAGAGGRVREVLMGCEAQPWLFAQTLIPDATIAASPWLLALGETPMGDELFARDDVERGEFLYAQLDERAPLAVRAREVVSQAGRSPLWARRSYFFIAGHPLLVNEVFLPALIAHCGD